jgi:hypothetical protein
MSTRYSLAQRTSAHNRLFAALACAITLTLTAGPALAQEPALERVEISGRVVEAPTRYDVRANCPDITEQLGGYLHNTWVRERRYGEVKVNLLMEGGEITAVQARGISHAVSRAVRNAVHKLDCGPQKVAGAQVYRFSVDFVDPYSDEYRNRDTQTAKGQPAVRIAMSRD